ncbi:MAG: hypothetical protein H7Z37_01385 [Pyrinomonadaceae bacterium]|nr:hypothetical protein [Pyrinomonadaceae bacterium]
MRLIFTRIYNQKSRFVALLLCIWLSGATCAVNCLAAHRPKETVANDAGAMCPLKNHGCCKGKTAKSDANEISSNFGERNDAPTFNCCSLANVKSEAARNLDKFDAFVSTDSTPKTYFAQPKRQTISFRKSYQTPPQNRGKTYIKHCVFLI